MTVSTEFQRLALRAARKIHAHLSGLAGRPAAPDLPQASWNELSKTLANLHAAERRGWSVARQSLALEVDYLAGRVKRELEQLRQSLPAGPASVTIPAAGQIARDLFSLETEFAEVELNLRSRTVGVRTDPITLENVDLGNFWIVLHWDRIGQRSTYEIQAQVPSRPSGADGVIHPHVQDQRLCEGRGASAIRAALQSGRLSDFFLLVRQILENYNAPSAYVSLADWQNTIACGECGTPLRANACSRCEGCDRACCADCLAACQHCGNTVCDTCCGACSPGTSRCCHACSPPAVASRPPACPSCLPVQPFPDSKDHATNVSASPPPVSPVPAPSRPEADALLLG
jgi:hypothetical protein